MQQNPSSESYGHSASQEITCRLWNPQVQYRIRKVLPLVPILNQINPIHTLPPYFHKTHFNIFQIESKFSKMSLPFRPSNQNIVYISQFSNAW